MDRRDPALVTAMAASLALAVTTLLLPDAPWRAPLALFAGIWAPGYALVALAARRGRLVALERHALAVAAGLLLLPLVAILASEAVGFRASTLALAQLVLVLVAGAIGLARGGEPEPLARAPEPSWRAVAALGAVAAIAVLGALAPTLLAREAAPHSLAIEGAQVVARAGDAPVSGVLRITWEGEVVLSETVELAPHEEARFDVPPREGRGQLAASWAGREVHSAMEAPA